MDKRLNPAPIGGIIRAISSKSEAHRLFLCAALADRKTCISCADRSADIDATVRCLTALGAGFADGAVQPVGTPPRDAVLDCGESGSTLRFLLPVAAALGVRTTFVLHGRLAQRPLSPLWEELTAHGCALSRPTENTVLCEGRLHGGAFRIAGDVSSQFITGLLFALPLTGEESDVMLTSALESASYVALTLRALEAFGIRVEILKNGWHIPAGQCYHAPDAATVGGDWSNAAFWLCAGAISRSVTVTGLDFGSAQGDRKICDLLARFGAQVTRAEDTCTVSPAPLRGCTIDASDIPDLVPPLAVVAASAQGVTEIHGAARLRIKESDRLSSVAETLRALGARVDILPDGLRIFGGPLRGGEVTAQNDHRIAMMTALASSVCGGEILLHGAEAVEKSYPRFWADFDTLHA